MRRAALLRGLVAIAVVAVLVLSQQRAAHASTINFGGGAEDHFWNVNTMFCKDGFMVSAVEIPHPDGTTGDDLPFSLVLSRTSTLITTPLPHHVFSGVGGPNRVLPSVTVYYSYTTPLAASSAISITLERWEHGGNSADDDFGDNSVGDDRQVVPGVTGLCTLSTPPEFDEPPSPLSGSVLKANVGATLSFPVEASDDDGTDAVTLGATNLPPGASFSVPAPANPAVATFSWTPTASQVGTYTVTFTATDLTGRSTPAWPVTINVQQSAVFLPLVMRGGAAADLSIADVSLAGLPASGPKAPQVGVRYNVAEARP